MFQNKNALAQLVVTKTRGRCVALEWQIIEKHWSVALNQCGHSRSMSVGSRGVGLCMRPVLGSRLRHKSRLWIYEPTHAPKSCVLQGSQKASYAQRKNTRFSDALRATCFPVTIFPRNFAQRLFSVSWVRWPCNSHQRQYIYIYIYI